MSDIKNIQNDYSAKLNNNLSLWIVDSALKRNEKTMRERVANEIFDAFNNK